MKIAIVAPSAVPFCIGGAEKLWMGLQAAINNNSPHQADLIKLPSRETSFWELIDSYRRFSELDLSDFDCVISTKYPAWMVSHPKHICYLQHRLRGLYDTYQSGDCQSEIKADPAVSELRDFMDRHGARRESLPEFWTILDRMKTEDALSATATSFPGPFIRDIVRFMDNAALAPDQISKFAAISQNVKSRRGYFPHGCDVQVVNHPSDLPEYRCGAFDYFFTASRIDGPKRIDLIVSAFKQTSCDIPLKIAGTGPDEERVKELAAGDQRIEFLGFVPDEDVIDLYANALAAIYVPFDEDYGLITIEAMMSGKPVITTIDSGGPTEFVIDGETGLCATPDPAALAAKIQELAARPEEALRMGRRARNRVRHITWQRTVDALLSPPPETDTPEPLPPKREKITVGLTYPIYPPRGGGQLRAYHIYSNLARHYDCDLVTFTDHELPAFQGEIAPNMREIRTPKSREHQQKEWRIEEKLGEVCTDLAMLELYSLTPDYMRILEHSTADASTVIVSHPYLLPAIREVYKGAIWYDAHNIEYDMKQASLPDNPTARRLLAKLRDVESQCCNESERVLACSSEDAENLCKFYNCDPSRIAVVPNGVDIESIEYKTQAQRKLLKRDCGVEESFIALFIGSWHPPNIAAVKSIAEMASQMKDVRFLMLGSVCNAFQKSKLPSNIGLLGQVDDIGKQVALDISDCALNPITSGSGTNLKMLEYMASGVPAVSTEFGCRGLAACNEEHLLFADLEDFPNAIQRLREEEASLISARCARARKHVENRFDWTVIVDNFLKQYGVI